MTGRTAAVSEIAQALLDPAAYPGAPESIELIRTRRSLVFLAGEYAYKVRKAVNLGYADYTTLERRRAFCKKEVELGRRLSPELYVGVVPVTRDGGQVLVEGKGETLEYAVKMQRLQRDRMMDVLLPQDGVTLEMVGRVAARLVDFHSRTVTGEAIGSYGRPEAVARNAGDVLAQTGQYVGRTVSQEKYDCIRNFTQGFVRDGAGLLDERVEEGRVRDCHGDLRAGHVCLADGISIYGGLEFSDSLRYSDVASDVVSLAVDIDHFGQASLSRHLVRTYMQLSGDMGLPEVLRFYRCYRACFAGMVESSGLDDPTIDVSEKQQIAETAEEYLDLAWFYTRSRPVLLITSGLVGTGKTTIARVLGRRLGLVVVSSDATRKQLAGIPVIEHRYERLGAGIYSPEFTRRTYAEMFKRAREILWSGDSVILDASFTSAEYRLRARELAEEANADFAVVECTAPEDILRERLVRRQRERSISDARQDVLDLQKGLFAPVSEVPDDRHIVVDTSQPVHKVIEEIESGMPPASR